MTPDERERIVQVIAAELKAAMVEAVAAGADPDRVYAELIQRCAVWRGQSGNGIPDRPRGSA